MTQSVPGCSLQFRILWLLDADFVCSKSNHLPILAGTLTTLFGSLQNAVDGENYRRLLKRASRDNEFKNARFAIRFV